MNLPNAHIVLAAILLTPLRGEEKITYDDHVFPIFENRCVNCHNPDKTKGDLDLTTYQGVQAGSSGGAVISPGDPDDSILKLVITHELEPIMPPKGEKLSKAEIEIISRWIAGGLLESKDGNVVAAKKKEVDLSVGVTSEKPKIIPMPGPLAQDPVVVGQRPSAITALATNPWSPLIAAGGPRQVVLYHQDTQEVLGILPFEEGFPEILTFSRNGSLLLAGGGRGGKSGSVVIWDVFTGERQQSIGKEFDTVLAADISADHQFVALGGPGRTLKIYRVSDGSEQFAIKKHPDWITAIRFSPDGKLLATADRHGGLHIWEPDKGIERFTLKGHTKMITGLSWRADSKTLVSSSEDGSIRVWNMKNGKQIKTWKAHGEGVLDITFSQDGTRVATAGRDQTAAIYDPNGKEKARAKGFDDIVTEVAFSYDQKAIITGDWKGTIRIVDATNGKAMGEFDANPASLATRIARLTEEVKQIKADPEKGALLKTRLTKLRAAAYFGKLVEQRRQVQEMETRAQSATSAEESRWNNLIAEIKKATTKKKALTKTAIAAKHRAAAAARAANEARDDLAAEESLNATYKALLKKTPAHMTQTREKLKNLQTATVGEIAKARVEVKKTGDEATRTIASAKKTSAALAALVGTLEKKRSQKKRFEASTTTPAMLAQARNVLEKMETDYAALEK